MNSNDIFCKKISKSRLLKSKKMMDEDKKNKQGVLKPEMIYQKTRTQNLADVRTLNMWGYELEDVSIASHLVNAETISFPINKIRTLAPFQTCKNLHNLLLRQNQISDINEIQYLIDLPCLKNLTLADNPVASMPGYRETVISALPQLEKLDEIEVSMMPPPRIQKKIQQFQQPKRSKKKNNQNIHKQFFLDDEEDDFSNFENADRNDYNNMNRRNADESNNNFNFTPVKKQFNILEKIDYHQAQIPQNQPKISYNQSFNQNDSNFSQSHPAPNNHTPTNALDEHLLTAVLSLIPELSVESLQIVLEAIRDRFK